MPVLVHSPDAPPRLVSQRPIDRLAGRRPQRPRVSRDQRRLDGDLEEVLQAVARVLEGARVRRPDVLPEAVQVDVRGLLVGVDGVRGVALAARGVDDAQRELDGPALAVERALVARVHAADLADDEPQHLEAAHGRHGAQEGDVAAAEADDGRRAPGHGADGVVVGADAQQEDAGVAVPGARVGALDDALGALEVVDAGVGGEEAVGDLQDHDDGEGDEGVGCVYGPPQRRNGFRLQLGRGVQE